MTKRIWLCADDYGISASVDAAIRDLVMRGRINATSVMVAAPSFQQSKASALNDLNADRRRIAIGLHVTLTAPFRPLSRGFEPLQDGAFHSLATTLIRACLRGLTPAALEAEIAGQVRAFVDSFGRTPDFIDGHQHVHLFPQVRDAVLKIAKRDAPNAWLRQCGRVPPHAYGIGDRKGFLLDVLSRTFRHRAAAAGVRTNPAFAGTYAFRDQANFAAMFSRFLEQMPDGGVIMCHPGVVDTELQKLDPLTTLREQEYAFFKDDGFPELLARHNITLA